MKQKLRNAIEAIHGIRIPEIPEEVLQLEALLKGKFPNLAEVAGIIEKNTTLSGETLKIVNSPVMKVKEPIQSIRDAVNNLGLNNIYNLVVVSALTNIFNKPGLVKDIMDNSVDVAYCMAEISEFVHGISRDEAYMLGLFHNSGAMMLAEKDPEGYGSLFSNALSNPISTLVKEEEKYRSNHAVIGVLITQKWKLPLPMINSVLLHHNNRCQTIKNDEVRTMVAMLKLSNSIVAEISLGAYCGGEARHYEQDAIHELMIDEKEVKEIRSSLMAYALKT